MSSFPERIVTIVLLVLACVVPSVPGAVAMRGREPISPALQRELDTVIEQMSIARDSGQVEHYDRAQQALDRIRKLDRDNYDALRLQGWVQSGRHEFDAALLSAKRAAKERPYDSWNYGVIVDANVELGRYPEAIEAAQKMVDLQPSPGAYSRIAYLRWLHGDPEGAEEMLLLALDSAAMGSAEADWTRTQLGSLQFDRGMLTEAETEHRRVLETNPGYVHALAGLAKVEAARGRYPQSIALYRKALKAGHIAEYDAALGDVYTAAGDAAKARSQYQTVERELKRRIANPETKMQLAIFWSDHGMQTSRALQYAEADIATADDIQAWDATAWARYRAGRYKGALEASKRATRLGTRDPRLLYHAGMIRHKTGDAAGASRFLRQALDINPSFHPIDAKEARATLREIEQEPVRRSRAQMWLLVGALPVAAALGYALARRRARSIAE